MTQQVARATPRLPSEIWVQILQIVLEPISLLRTFVCTRGDQRAKLRSIYRQMQILRLVNTNFFHAISMIPGVQFEQVRRLYMLSRLDWEMFLWDPVAQHLMVVPWRNRCEYVHDPEGPLAIHDPGTVIRMVLAEEPSSTEDSLVTLLTLPEPLAFRKLTICSKNAHLWLYGVARRLSELAVLGGAQRWNVMSSERDISGLSLGQAAVNVLPSNVSPSNVSPSNVSPSGEIPDPVAQREIGPEPPTIPVQCHVKQLRIQDCGEGYGWVFESEPELELLGIPGETRTLREWCADGIRALSAALRPLTLGINQGEGGGDGILVKPFQCPTCWRVEFSLKRRCDLHPQVDPVALPPAESTV